VEDAVNNPEISPKEISWLRPARKLWLAERDTPVAGEPDHIGCLTKRKPEDLPGWKSIYVEVREIDAPEEEIKCPECGSASRRHDRVRGMRLRAHVPGLGRRLSDRDTGRAQRTPAGGQSRFTRRTAGRDGRVPRVEVQGEAKLKDEDILAEALKHAPEPLASDLARVSTELHRSLRGSGAFWLIAVILPGDDARLLTTQYVPQDDAESMENIALMLRDRVREIGGLPK
jgi:hypothetical protein